MVDRENQLLTDDFFLAEVKKIMNVARKNNVVIRLIGALAIKLHSIECGDLFKRLGRLGEGKPNFSDIDFIGYSKQRMMIMKLFTGLGYFPDRYIVAFFGSKRLLYYHPQKYYHIDIFLDKLEFSHEVSFVNELGKGRLEIHDLTISLSDLVLEKLQIHQITEKDIKDLIILFQTHKLGGTDEAEIINAKYIAKVLATDWGFWYDATENLKKVVYFAERYHRDRLIDEETLHGVNVKVSRLLEIINDEPKTKEWHKRARNGTNKKWYKDVEELVR